MWLIELICEVVSGVVGVLLFAFQLLTLLLAVTFAFGAIWREVERWVERRRRG